MAVLSACVTTVTQGHLKEDEAISAIHIGTTTKDEALKALGSPSSQSSFGPLAWYYVSSVKKNRSLFAPTIADQRVLEIGFDNKGVVSSIRNYSLADSKNIEIASRTTPAEGQTLGFFEQIMSNLGRFNKDDNSSGVSHTHSTIGAPGGYPSR